MQSQWSDRDAERMVKDYKETGTGRDLALRVYTARHLGRDRPLVLHGSGLAVVPAIRPGCALAKRAAQVARANPDAFGLVLHKHGIFTFGENAWEAYERMIDSVSRAEDALKRGRKTAFKPAKLAKKL